MLYSSLSLWEELEFEGVASFEGHRVVKIFVWIHDFITIFFVFGSGIGLFLTFFIGRFDHDAPSLSFVGTD